MRKSVKKSPAKKRSIKTEEKIVSSGYQPISSAFCSY